MKDCLMSLKIRKNKSPIFITLLLILALLTGLTAGRVMDYGLRDSMNMGGCMAPAACDTIARSFSDFGRTPSDYDAVFTGDLGIIGQKILLDLLEEQNIRLSPIHKDCGILI